MSAAGFAFAAAWIFAGIGFGVGYFAALRRSIEAHHARGTGLASLAFTLGRIAFAVLFFGLAVRFGALPPLAALLGFLIARSFAFSALRGSA